MATMLSAWADWSNSTSGYGICSYDGFTTSVTFGLSGGPGSIVNVNGPAGTCDYTGLSPSTTYTASFQANPFGNTLTSSFTTPSGGGGGGPDPDPADSVTDLTATPHDGYVHLSWPSVGNADYYRVYYRRVSPLGPQLDADVYSTTTDIFDVTNHYEYSFYVEAWNSDGHGGASPVRYATPAPSRPSDFNWTTPLGPTKINITAADWMFLRARINMFRDYKNVPVWAYGGKGPGALIKADDFSDLCESLDALRPWITSYSAPGHKNIGDKIFKSYFENVRLTLNSIP